MQPAPRRPCATRARPGCLSSTSCRRARDAAMWQRLAWRRARRQGLWRCVWNVAESRACVATPCLPQLALSFILAPAPLLFSQACCITAPAIPTHTWRRCLSACDATHSAAALNRLDGLDAANSAPGRNYRHGSLEIRCGEAMLGSRRRYWSSRLLENGTSMSMSRKTRLAAAAAAPFPPASETRAVSIRRPPPRRLATRLCTRQPACGPRATSRKQLLRRAALLALIGGEQHMVRQQGPCRRALCRPRSPTAATCRAA